MRAIAVDGKTLRGSKNREGKRVRLLSAVDHAAAACLAQRNVGSKTNETGEFIPLLAWMNLQDTVMTFDALHTVKAQASWLIEAKGANYVAIVMRTRSTSTASSRDCPGSRLAVAASLPGGAAS